MKQIVVQNQVRIGVARCLALSVAGMSHRMFRSAVTVSILALAMAFLAHVLGYGLIDHRTRLIAYGELKDHWLLGEWVQRLAAPDSEEAILEALAEDRPARLAEYRTWSGAGEEEFRQACQSARRLVALQEYLGGLSIAARTVLVAGLDVRGVVRQLNDPARLEMFLRHVAELKLDVPLGGAEALRRLAGEEYPGLTGLARRIQVGQATAIRAVREKFPGRTPRALLATMPPDLAEVLSEAGFHPPTEKLPLLADLAQKAEDLAKVNEAIALPEVVTAVARRMDVPRTDVTPARVMAWLNSRERAEWLVGALAEHVGGVRMEPGALRALAVALQQQEALCAAVGDEPPTEAQGLFAVPGWMRWLILLSFLVCTVGVANAMFMSVTERFTEIATMKCLGAMDGFIHLLFVFESGLQGLVGAAAGIVVGFALALVRGLAVYGGLMTVPVREILVGAGACLAAGLVLAVLAGVGPAWAAARLAPMEAMRIE